MKKKIRLLFTVIIIITVFNNCNLNKKKPIYLYKLNFKDSLTINVIRTAIHGKALIVNDSVVLYKSSRLIFQSYKPEWLFDKTKNKELSNEHYIYTPDISEVDAPYKLNKYKKSNIFQIIKGQDTLNFDFENFDELDY